MIQYFFLIFFYETLLSLIFEKLVMNYENYAAYYAMMLFKHFKHQ